MKVSMISYCQTTQLNNEWFKGYCCLLYVIQVLYFLVSYLQACALVRERRAKETCDNAHDGLSYITLQRSICMFPVTGVVAHLDKNRKHISMTHSHWITLPACGRQVKHLMLCFHKKRNLWYNIDHPSRCQPHFVMLDTLLSYPTNVHKEVLKQLPHMIGGIDFFHLHLCVDIAVV